MLARGAELRGLLQDREKEKNLEMIKKQYLGAEKVKKKMLKPSEKFKFNFDWEAGDDTSRCPWRKRARLAVHDAHACAGSLHSEAGLAACQDALRLLGWPTMPWCCTPGHHGALPAGT